jgi:hypothetical protein
MISLDAHLDRLFEGARSIAISTSGSIAPEQLTKRS